MAWRRPNRAARYAGRAHDLATQPRRMALQTPVVPERIDWKVRPGETVSHAFSTGPGWMRAVCRSEPWTVLLQPATEDATPCADCSLLVSGAPGEIVEAWGK